MWHGFFGFSDHRITRCPDHPISAALCLRPSARDPTPIGVLLKTKAKVQFDSLVDKLSKPFFGHF